MITKTALALLALSVSTPLLAHSAMAQSGPAPRYAASTDAPVFTPAPMPDQEIFAPRQAASNDPSFEPKLYQPRNQFRGDGFGPGSTAQGAQERSIKPAPGVAMVMPIN